jgi:hypothetical protein
MRRDMTTMLTPRDTILGARVKVIEETLAEFVYQGQVRDGTQEEPPSLKF